MPCAGINSVTEYLIELRRSAAKNVPSDWLQVSTTKEFVRFHTPQVVELIKKLQLHREEVMLAAQDAWVAWLGEVGAACAGPLRRAVGVLAQIDCLASLAVVAKMPGYCRPTIVEPSEGDGGPVIRLEAGRHPMAELAGSTTVQQQLHKPPLLHANNVASVLCMRGCVMQRALGAPNLPGMESQFVPNDVKLGGADPRYVDLPELNLRVRSCAYLPTAVFSVLVLSGPNMGGKSSYVRMAALLTLMAHIGSYVRCVRGVQGNL